MKQLFNSAIGAVLIINLKIYFMKQHIHQLIIVGTLLVFTQCKQTNTTEEKSSVQSIDTTHVTLTEAQYKEANIQLGTWSTKSISSIIKANGKIDVPPQNMLSVSVPLGGLVKQTSLLQGTHVKVGDVLAVLENSEYIKLQQEYAESYHQLLYLETEKNRQSELQAAQINATKTYQKSIADYDMMKVRVEALKQQLVLLGIAPKTVLEGKISSTISLRSSIDGYVTKVLVNKGKFVQTNEVLFELVDTRHTHCELQVFEQDIPLIQLDDKVEFSLTSDATKRKASVHLIGKEINSDRTVQVHCHMDKEDPSLLPGSYITAYIYPSSKSTTALPKTAFVLGEQTNYIYILESVSTEKNDKGINENAYHFLQIPIHSFGSDDQYRACSIPNNLTSNSKIVLNNAHILRAVLLNKTQAE